MVEIKSLSGNVLLKLDAKDLIGANLRGSNLGEANLYHAYLRGSNLLHADLRYANLSDANLSDANLYGANLYGANLSGANLRGANLRGANLSYANLSGAKLSYAKLPHFQICPEVGPFIAWKKTTAGVIQVMIPDDAQRTSSLVGRKCRASHVVVGITEPGSSPTSSRKLDYIQGETVYADKFDPDIRVECTHGIHFFMTKAEAEEYY